MDESKIMSNQLDIFSRPAPITQTAGKAARVPALKVRILDFFRSKRYESFLPPEIASRFPSSDPKVVRKAIAQLEKSGYLVATGKRKGEEMGMDNYYITLNLSKR